MGSKTDGFPIRHIKNPCCYPSPVMFTFNGNHSLVWCKECGKYFYNKPTQSLIALYMGDFEAVKAWNGYLPDWLNKLRVKAGLWDQIKKKLLSIFKGQTSVNLKRVMDEIDKLEADYIA